MYIHCLDGRRITGLLVILLRRLQGWPPVTTMFEFWQYQQSSRAVSLTANEVEKITKELEIFARDVPKVTMTEFKPKWLWYNEKVNVSQQNPNK